jgi:hypothetical protein
MPWAPSSSRGRDHSKSENAKCGWSIKDVYARWGGSESGAAYLAVAARDCLPAASATLLRALHDYPRTHWIRVQAVSALAVMDPGSGFIDSAAEVLLDPGDEVALTGTARPTIQALCDGMTPDNAEARVELVARRLASKCFLTVVA